VILPVFIAALTLHTPLQVQVDSSVTQWIKSNAHPLKSVVAESGFEDLQPFREIIGNARIVSMGEATHGTREVFQMKHRMLEFLVKEMGFTVLGIEASFPDCLTINDYVLTGKGNLGQVLDAQGFWTWNTEEVAAMIEWMRRYNADPKTKQPVKFYGYDMQNPASAIRRSLGALEKVDATLAKSLEGKLSVLSQRSVEAFRALSVDQRAAQRQALEEMLSAFDSKKSRLIEELGAGYLDAKQCAVIALQAEQLYADMADQPTGLNRTNQATGETRALFGRLHTSIAVVLQLVDKLPSNRRAPARDFLVKLSRGGELQQDFFLKHSAAERTEMRSLVTELRSIEQNDATADIAAALARIEAFATRRLPTENWRDLCMAKNQLYILEREGPGTRIMGWAHNGHVNICDDGPRTGGAMGRYLNEFIGKDHLAVGFSLNKGSLQAIYSPLPKDSELRGLLGFNFNPAQPGSVDHVLGSAGVPRFFLDLRKGDSPQVKKWLNTAAPMRTVGAVFAPENDSRGFSMLAPGQCFDVIIYLDQTSRAIPMQSVRVKYKITNLEPINQ